MPGYDSAVNFRHNVESGDTPSASDSTLKSTFEKMKTYPTLSEMGILHPEHIDSFSINSIGYTDVLRIAYERPKGSILPLTRTYKFPRIQKTVQGASEPAAVMESNPAFHAAIEELKSIHDAKGNKQNVAGEILEELRLLEEDISLRSEYIKGLVSKI